MPSLARRCRHILFCKYSSKSRSLGEVTLLVEFLLAIVGICVGLFVVFYGSNSQAHLFNVGTYALVGGVVYLGLLLGKLRTWIYVTSVELKNEGDPEVAAILQPQRKEHRRRHVNSRISMSSDTQLPQIDWLELFQENWRNAQHFMLINQRNEAQSERWLMCDPSVDPTKAQSLEELKLLFYLPRQVLPPYHFTATMKGENLVISHRNQSYDIIPSKQHGFYTHLDDGQKIEFDPKSPEDDIFFHPIHYNDEILNKGDFVLFDDTIWNFIRWSDAKLELKRYHRVTGDTLTETPTFASCLRAERDVPKRTPKPKASTSQAYDSFDVIPSLFKDSSIPPTQRKLKPD